MRFRMTELNGARNLPLRQSSPCIELQTQHGPSLLFRYRSRTRVMLRFDLLVKEVDQVL